MAAMDLDDLVEFLREGLAEDEVWARSVLGDAARLGFGPGPLPWRSRVDTATRVLREVEAKRRIINSANEWPYGSGDPENVEVGWADHADLTLRLLALPRSDHPNYRAEWKP